MTSAYVRRVAFHISSFFDFLFSEYEISTHCIQEKGVIERKVNKIKEITGGTGCNIMIRS